MDLASFDRFIDSLAVKKLPKKDEPQCGRLTRKGKGSPCRLPLISDITTPWKYASDEPMPHSCPAHLTAEEKATAQLARERYELVSAKIHDRPPACHTWDPPLPNQNMWTWQRDRCAICGDKVRLLIDHCHETGLVRGGLCNGCNSREGRYPGGTFGKYRVRPPSVMVGYATPYYLVVGGDYAEPTDKAVKYLGPRPEDPVKAAAYLARAVELPRHDYDVEDGWENNATVGLFR